MNSLESNTLSFVINIWLEQTDEEGDRAIWRGHITHVLSGDRRYVQDLDGISVFILPYLESMGVKLEICWRVRLWLNRCRLFLKTRLG